jgi:plastocyanin
MPARRRANSTYVKARWSRFALVVSAVSGLLTASALAGSPSRDLWIVDRAFVPAKVINSQGGTLTVSNADGEAHDLTAIDDGPDGRPLFRADVESGNQVVVEGTRFLSTGDYAFVCTIHAGMTGMYSVTDDGDPVARPAIDVKVHSSRIARVRRTGKVAIRVNARQPTVADGVSLTLKRGRKTLGQMSGLALAAGERRKLTMTLSKSDRKDLAGLAKVRLKLLGDVEFGAPDRASKLLD